jgi:hypothetical protein
MNGILFYHYKSIQASCQCFSTDNLPAERMSQDNRICHCIGVDERVVTAVNKLYQPVIAGGIGSDVTIWKRPSQQQPASGSIYTRFFFPVLLGYWLDFFTGIFLSTGLTLKSN